MKKLFSVLMFLLVFMLSITIVVAAEGEDMLDSEHINPWTTNPGLVEYDGEVYDLDGNTQRILYACHLLRNGIFVPDPPPLEFDGGQYSIDENGNAVLEVSMQNFYDAKGVYESTYGDASQAPAEPTAAPTVAPTPEPTATAIKADNATEQSILNDKQESDEIIQAALQSVSDQMEVSDKDNSNFEWAVPVFFVIVGFSVAVGLIKKFRNMKNQ